MSLYVKGKDVPNATVPMRVSGGQLSTKQVFGIGMSLMIAERSGGYHSKPHIHSCEQLNYVSSGEIWIYVEEQGYYLRQGDFLRVPGMAVHWAWNKSDDPCSLVEVHAPGLDLLPSEQTVDLLESHEAAADVRRVPNKWASEEYAHIEDQRAVNVIHDR